MSGRLGKGKEEGVAPSSSGLLETDQEGGVSNSLFPSLSHSSSVGASGKPSADQVREKEEKVRKRLKEILEKLDLLSFQSFDLDERLWEADLAWESAQPGKDKKEKRGEVGKLKAEIAELEEQVERLEKMKGNMLKWARGERLGPKRNLTGPLQLTPSLSTSPSGVSSGSSLFFVPIYCFFVFRPTTDGGDCESRTEDCDGEGEIGEGCAEFSFQESYEDKCALVLHS